jgi:hypothetical protein
MDDILVMYFRWTLDLVTSKMLVSKKVVLLLYPKPTVMKTTFTTTITMLCSTPIAAHSK